MSLEFHGGLLVRGLNVAAGNGKWLHTKVANWNVRKSHQVDNFFHDNTSSEADQLRAAALTSRWTYDDDSATAGNCLLILGETYLCIASELEKRLSWLSV